MAQGLGISEIINIDTSISSGGIGPADFGSGLLLVNNDSLSAAGSGKIRRFTSYDEVVGVFDNETIQQESAIWFESDPSPKSLYIARITPSNVNTKLVSKILTDTDRNAINNLTNGTMVINGNKIADGISPASNTGVDIASAIKSSIRTADSNLFANTEVEYSTSTGRITIEFIGPSNKAFHQAITIANGTGNSAQNIGENLGFVSSEAGFSLTERPSGANESTLGAYYLQGHEAQGVGQALSEVIGFASKGRPTNIMLSNTVPDTINVGTNNENSIAELRTFAQAGDYITAFVESATFSGSTIATGSQIALSKGQSKVMAIYSDASDTGTSNRRVDIAVLAKLSSQNFDQPQSIITLVPKSLPGVGTTNVTNQIMDGLETANASVYATVGGYPAFLGGKVSNGTWIDAQYWLAWLKNEMELNIYNAMRQSSRFDNIELTDTIHQVMAKAINTGGIKLGGKVNAAIKKEIRIVTNNPGFDGTLQNGYLLYITPYSSLTDLGRRNRQQNFKVWISPSEAIHSVDGAIVLNG